MQSVANVARVHEIVAAACAGDGTDRLPTASLVHDFANMLNAPSF